MKFLNGMLVDVNTADRAAWVAAGLAAHPSHASSLQPMAREVAVGHSLTDVFDWDHDAPTNNTVLDGIMTFEQWLASRGYALLYFECWPVANEPD